VRVSGGARQGGAGRAGRGPEPLHRQALLLLSGEELLARCSITSEHPLLRPSNQVALQSLMPSRPPVGTACDHRQQALLQLPEVRLTAPHKPQDEEYLYLIMEYLPGGDTMVGRGKERERKERCS
jgi:hypothetical protein